MMDETLRRIADALERLAPPPPGPVDGGAAAYAWTGFALAPTAFAPLSIDLLTGIDAQKAVLLENTRRHARGTAAHDALLWGARGTGKSALVKASIGAVRDGGDDVALVDLATGRLDSLPALFDVLSGWGRAVMVFIDDLGFDDGMGGARALRSVLDGGSRARPANVRLYVTSNQRHIVPREMSEQHSPISQRDVVEDRLALADRFGLSIGFHLCDQQSYLAMVERYAAVHGLPFDAQDATGFATARGSRSGRVAWHYLVELAGRHDRRLDRTCDA